MIKAIIFDFGNVIYHFDNNIFLDNISHFTDNTVPELHDLIYVSSDLPRQYESGLIDSDEFFLEIKRKCNLSILKHEFINAYTDIFRPNITTLECIRKIKSRCKIALLSNTNEWHFEYIIKPCEVYGLFDAESLSFQVHAMKPDERIFKDALWKLKVKPEESVYIDDIEEYVEASKDIGMNGIHYVSYEKLIHSLAEFQINI